MKTIIRSILILLMTAATASADTLPEPAAPMAAVSTAQESRAVKIGLFTRWFEQQGGKFMYDIALEEVPGFGLGLVAHEPVPKGAEYLTIPYKLAIGMETVLADNKVGPVFSELNKTYGADARFALILYLLNQKLVAGAKSAIAPYIDTLPASYPDSPLFYSSQDLDMLMGSEIYSDIVNERESLRGQYESLKKRVFEKYPEHFPSAKIGFTEFLWGIGTYNSRINYIEGRTPREHFIPMADMVNCQQPKPRDDTLKGVEDNGRYLFMAANANTRAGEQLFFSYGYKSNWELFKYLGFLLDDTGNRCVWMRLPYKEGTREKFGYYGAPLLCVAADEIEQKRLVGKFWEYLRFLAPEPKGEKELLTLLLAEVEARLARNPYDVTARPEQLAKRYMIFEKTEFLRIKQAIEQQLKTPAGISSTDGRSAWSTMNSRLPD